MAVQWLRLCLPMKEMGVRSLVRELRPHIPYTKNPKQNRSNIVTNSIQPLKMVHIKKKKKKKKELKIDANSCTLR